MIGQLTDIKDINSIENIIRSNIKKYEIEDIPNLNKIKYLSYDKIIASFELLNACISHILTNHLFTYKKSSLLNKIDEFIKENLDNNLSATKICNHFGISRTSLYNLFKISYKMGVSEYIMKFKIERAKELLSTTNLKVNEISILCGFNDYNYFSKVFKNKTKYSPLIFRNKN